MKTIKYIIAIMVFVILLFGCKKPIFKGTEYVIKGRLMHSCDVPAANAEDLLINQMSQPLFGQKGASFYFDTDDEGYFEIVYNSKDAIGTEFEIRKNGTLLEGIPANENVDLGEVLWSFPKISYIRRLEVNNPYSENDTLIVPDYNNMFSDSSELLRIPGPFENVIIDTVWNRSVLEIPRYNQGLSLNTTFRLSNSLNVNKIYIQIDNYCLNTDGLYEAVHLIE